MCEFISFIVADEGKGLDIFVDGDLTSHHGNMHKGYECEWTKDDSGESLDVRVSPRASDNHADTIKNFILSRYPTWRRFAKWAIAQIDWANNDQDMDLSGSDVTHDLLPENLFVSGSLDVEGCDQLTKLPDGLKVRGSLLAEGSALKSLPNNLMVGKNLYVSGCELREFPNGLVVGGCADFANIQFAYARVPDDVLVGGYLNLGGTNAHAMPRFLKVCDDLITTESMTIPDHFRMGFANPIEERDAFEPMRKALRLESE